MRSVGRSLLEKGFFELDLGASKVTWVNDYVLSKIGMSLEQATSFTVFDIIPEEFHESLNSFIFDASRGRASKLSIWPYKTADDELAWWYFSIAKADHPVHWFKAEFLNKTRKSGPEFASMCAAMNAANYYNDLFNKLADFQVLTKGSMDLLNQRYAELKDDQEVLREQIVGAVDAATRAANAALNVSATIASFKSDVQDQFSNQTAEILRLISTDVVHDRRIEAFEKHMKVATDTAVAAIAVQASKAGQTITTQAKKAGDGLARRVTIPVSAVAAVMAIVQWLIAHWPK